MNCPQHSCCVWAVLFSIGGVDGRECIDASCDRGPSQRAQDRPRSRACEAGRWQRHRPHSRACEAGRRQQQRRGGTHIGCSWWQVSAPADSARETHSAYLSGACLTYTSHNNKILNSIFICMFDVYVCVYTYMYTCGTFTGACFQTQQLARVMLEA